MTFIFPRGHISGLTLSVAGGSSTFNVAAGQAADSTNTVLMNLAAALSKTTGAWAAGTGNGALDTGAIANSTWYHAFAINRVDTGAVDALVSLSAAAPTLPASYTLFRRVGSMKTDGSGNWIAFVQNNDEFLWVSPPLDLSGVIVSNGSAALVTMSCPLGIQTNVLFEGYCTSTTSGIQAYISSPDQTDIATPNGTTLIVPSASGFGTFSANVRTNLASQFRWRANGGIAVSASTKGWIDARGKAA